VKALAWRIAIELAAMQLAVALVAVSAVCLLAGGR
jgi:hypothetical protein